MSSNLQEERKKVSFNIKDLSIYIYKNEENYNRIMDAYKILCEDPVTRNDPAILGKGRIDQFRIYAEKGLRIHQVFNTTESDMISVCNHFSNQLPGSTGVYMFLPYIRHLGTDKQIEKWVEPILRGEVIGSYSQTELGHGSDVRSLETTATYDQAADQFIIHSPTLTSTKWWPGDLGLVSNHTVCMAQLIIDGKNYGVHGFIIPIRDLNTNKTLPGIEAGDIGEKFGFNTKDNGFAIFNQVRIPRDNMLMRYSKVSKKGEYKRLGDERIGYAIMMQIRDMICTVSWKCLSHAMVIATRYSLFRTQFQDEDGKERPVLDYQLQQDKLIPLLAITYAMHAGSLNVSRLAQENIKRIQEKEDFSMMKDLHATLCGTKAFYSTETETGINKARLACGGHGYSSYSGFTSLAREFSPNVTYEGENTVMALQTARYLLNCLEKLRKGSQVQESVSYLRNLKEILSIQKCQAKAVDDFNIDVVFDALKANAAYLVYAAAKSLMEGAKDGSFKDSWDKTAGIQLVEAARAHTAVYTYKAFYDRINDEIKAPALKAVMRRLCTLYGIEIILRHPLGLVESEYVAPKQFIILNKRKQALLQEIRPDVIGLVDAFSYPDNTLRSALGQYDGNPYETLLKWARESNEFNKYDWTETWEKNIKGLRYVDRPTPKL